MSAVSCCPSASSPLSLVSPFTGPVVDGGEAIRVSGLVRQSIVDGPGLRLALFMQGCLHGCPGCHNPGSHDCGGGFAMEPDEVIAEFDRNPLLSGITLSGGDPILQSSRLIPVAKAVRERGKSVWCYTGYTFEELYVLRSDGSEFGVSVGRLCDLVDVLVDGRFVLAQRDLTLRFRGSANQRVLDLPRSLVAGKAVLAKI